MSSYVLGLSCYYHDSAAALLKDGEIISAAQEERFSRKKHDSSFPKNAVSYCLKSQKISLSDIKEIANSKDGNSILISYKGDSANADISLPNEYTVELNDDSIRDLEKRFGTENIQFVYHSQNHIN